MKPPWPDRLVLLMLLATLLLVFSLIFTFKFVQDDAAPGLLWRDAPAAEKGTLAI
ncbi:MAG: hypothetical protein AB8E87_11050 [Prochlorococcus sp.]|nr:hypothetical protein [Prochlorococcaceae cyanobacterium Fu_MAG_50]